MTMSCSCSGVLKARCQKQDKCSPSIDFNNITQWQPEYRNVLNPGEFGISKENVVYLTSVGKASSLQKDRETKRTPAGVAGGRLVISCSSCSASSSVGLGQDHSKRIQLNQKFQSILLFSTSETTNIHSVNKKRTKVFCWGDAKKGKKMASKTNNPKKTNKQSELVLHFRWLTWGQRCPWEHSRVGAERSPSPHVPLWGPSSQSHPRHLWRRHWEHGCCASEAG